MQSGLIFYRYIIDKPAALIFAMKKFPHFIDTLLVFNAIVFYIRSITNYKSPIMAL